MNHESRPGSSRLLPIGSASLLVLAAACSGQLDRDRFGSAPSATGGVAGWVLNGEGGEAPGNGGSSAGRRNDRPVPSTGAGTSGSGAGGASSGSGGSEAGPRATGGTAGAGAGGGPGTGGSAGSGSGGPMGDPRGGEGGAGTELPPPKVHAFVISEYVEGSSNNKAIELYASEASTLDGCELHFYFNGGFEPAALSLDGPVAARQAYALCTEELDAQITPYCARVASLRFNGNDAVSLVCDGVVLDTLGKVGDDPGKGWGSGETTTVDRTLRRRCDAAAEPTLNDDFDPTLAWDAFPIDSFDDLGRRHCAPAEGHAGAPGQGGEAGGGGAATGGAGAGAESVELE